MGEDAHALAVAHPHPDHQLRVVGEHNAGLLVPQRAIRQRLQHDEAFGRRRVIRPQESPRALFADQSAQELPLQRRMVRIADFDLGTNFLASERCGLSGLLAQEVVVLEPRLRGAGRMIPGGLEGISLRTKLRDRKEIVIHSEEHGQPDHLAQIRRVQGGRPQREELRQTAIATRARTILHRSERLPLRDFHTHVRGDLVHPRQREARVGQKRIAIVAGCLDTVFAHQMTGQQQVVRIAPAPDAVEVGLTEASARQRIADRAPGVASLPREVRLEVVL